MTNVFAVVGFILGVTVTLLFTVSLASDLREDNERLKRENRELKRACLDVNVELSGAKGLVKYQRDELYKARHPQSLIEYAED